MADANGFDWNRKQIDISNEDNIKHEKGNIIIGFIYTAITIAVGISILSELNGGRRNIW